MERRRSRIPAASIPVLVAWLVAMAVPLTSGAFWPVSVAPRLLAERATTFATDSISPLAVEGASWVLQPWLPAIAMYGAHAMAGVTGLVLLQGALSVAATILLYRLALAHARELPAIAASLAGLVLLLPSAVRTEQFAVLLGAVLMIMLRGRAWPAAPIVLALWANSHGSVPIGVMMVLAAALGMVRSPPARPAPLLRTAPLARAAWVAACIAAVLANPLGWEIVGYVASVRDIGVLQQVTPLWQGLDPFRGRGAVMLTIVGLVAFARRQDLRRSRIRSALTRPGAGLLPVLPLLVLAAASLETSRYLVWFALLATPELAAALDHMFDRLRWTTRLPLPVALPVILLLVAGTIALAPGSERQDRFARLGVPAGELLRGLDERDIVLASAEWANYVHLETGAQVVVDARLERYRAQDLRDYVGLVRDADGALLRRSGAGDVLIHRATAGAPWRARAARMELGGSVSLERAAANARGVRYRVEEPIAGAR